MPNYNLENSLNVADSTGNIINPATEEKQDDLITELKKKADLTEEQPITSDALEQSLSKLKLNAQFPAWLDATRNGLQVVSLTGSIITTVTTVSTVTTVGNISQIGSNNADQFIIDTSRNAWANSLRMQYV